MQNNDELDSLNRGYHLAYYGDIEGQNPPYYDLGQGSWQQTRQALVNRFRHESAAKRNSRLVDLYTFRRFLEKRGDKATSEEVEVIETIVNNLASYPVGVRLMIERECKEVIK